MKSRAIASMPGSAIALMEITSAPELSRLTEKEREIYAKFESDRRRCEWWSGRMVARRALEELGGKDLSILADPRGLPLIQGTGAERFFISISHGRRVAAAAATTIDAKFPCIGVDVVDQEDAERVHKIGPRFLTERERELGDEDLTNMMLAWGAREAIAKATSTGMFAFALKKGSIRRVDRGARRIEVDLPDIEVIFEAVEGEGLVILAGTTRAIADAAQAEAGLSQRSD